MHEFLDNQGRPWRLSITIGDAQRVRDTLDGIDLMDCLGGDLLPRLARDPYLLCDVLYVLLEDQAKERGLSDKDFGRALGGDAIDSAADALTGALIAFFRPAQRPALEAAQKKINQMINRASETALGLLNSEEMDRQFEADLANLARGRSFGESPELSESTPEASASDN
jgi:hypothetical protein